MNINNKTELIRICRFHKKKKSIYNTLKDLKKKNL